MKNLIITAEMYPAAWAAKSAHAFWHAEILQTGDLPEHLTL